MLPSVLEKTWILPGKCLCGCGKDTNICHSTNLNALQVDGYHAAYVVGHNGYTFFISDGLCRCGCDMPCEGNILPGHTLYKTEGNSWGCRICPHCQQAKNWNHFPRMKGNPCCTKCQINLRCQVIQFKQRQKPGEVHMCKCGCGWRVFPDRNDNIYDHIHGHGNKAFATLSTPTHEVDRGYETPCIEIDETKGTFNIWHQVVFTQVEDGRHFRNYIVEWEKVYGPVANNTVVKHYCNNESCQNIKHLYLVSTAVKKPEKPKSVKVEVSPEVMALLNKVEVIPKGFCKCGCGLETSISKVTNTRKELTKGEPNNFRPGHSLQNGIFNYTQVVVRENSEYVMVEPEKVLPPTPAMAEKLECWECKKLFPKVEFREKSDSPQQGMCLKCAAKDRIYRLEHGIGNIRQLPKEMPPVIEEAPYGICQCGCGERTEISILDNHEYGIFRGKPYPYMRGHRRRSRVKRVEQENAAMDVERVCLTCEKLQPIFNFEPHPRYGGFRRICRTCRE